MSEPQTIEQQVTVRKGELCIGAGTYIEGEWVDAADYRRLQRKLARPVLMEDEMHVLRILGNGQISAARAAEFIRDIRTGGKPSLPPFEVQP